MPGSAFEPYAPLNQPKPFGHEAWLVDGPEIRMDYGPFHLPFPTRMTVVRLASGELWLHSPIAPDEILFAEIDSLGEVAHIVAPNSIHYWYMTDWLERYPSARSYAVPGLAEKAKRSFNIDQTLSEDAELEWQDEIDWLLVPGSVVNEAVFFARSANLLILTDLIENFEAPRIHNPLLRWMIGLVGADGSAPIDLRMTFWKQRKQVRKQVARMLEWPAERVTMAHGKPHDSDVQAELQRAFKWAR